MIYDKILVVISWSYFIIIWYDDKI